MKKIISTLLAMAMALTLFSLPVMAKPHATAGSNLMLVEKIFETDFNGAAVNTSWQALANAQTGFYAQSSGASSTIAFDGDDGYLNVGADVILIAKQNDGTASWGTVNSYNVSTHPMYGEKNIVEFKFKLQEKPTANVTLYTANLNSTDCGSSAGPKLTVTSGLSLNYANGTTTATATALSTGRWYNVKVVNDMTNEQYDVYLDGILLLDDLAFAPGDSRFNDVDLRVFNRPFQFSRGNSTAALYLDDIKVYREFTGRQTFAADDFSGNGSDVVCSSSTEIKTFAGLGLVPRTGYQNGVTIDSENDRAVFSAGSSLSVVPITTWPTVDTDTEAITGQKRLSVEFDFTPSADTVGDFYTIGDALGLHYGLILSANAGKISAKIGREGNVTPSSANVGVDLAPFTAGETYRIKVYVDLDKKFTQNLTGNSIESHNKTHTRSGKADVYIDGKLVGSELPLRYNCGSTGNASYDITNLGKPFAANGGASATYYIDNLTVYTDVREKVLSTAFSTLNKRMAGQNINLPSSTETGYTVTWSTESDAITIQNNVASVVCGATAQKATLVATVKDAANQLSVTGEVYVTIPAAYELDVKTANEGSTIESVTFRDNNASGKAVDIYTVIYTVEDKAIASCKTVKNAVSATVNPLNISVAEGATVKYFVWENGTLVPVTFTKTVTE